MSDFPFDIPTTQPSGGGGGLPYAGVVTEANDIFTVPDNAVGIVIPDFEILITPTSATQKVSLSGVINGTCEDNSVFHGIILYRNGTSLAPTTGGSANRKVNGQFVISYYSQNFDFATEACPFSYIDDPQTTGQIKYEVYIVNGGSGNESFYLNRPITGSNSSIYKRMSTSFSAQCFEP